MKIKVGCCGFAVKGGSKAYYEEFQLVELQTTFYKLPRIATAEKWRREAPEDFEFTLKSWQAVTHPTSSPTWRRAGIRIMPDMANKYGLLRPSKENFEAWSRTKTTMTALKSRICVIQCPPAFEAGEEHIRNMREFFNSIDRKGVQIAWEPRHKTWHNNLALTKKMCDDLDLIHTVDIFKRQPVSKNSIAYIRLHGLPGEINYAYKYTNKDLKLLAEKVLALQEQEKEEAYVLFNNLSMANDSKKLIKILSYMKNQAER